MASVAQSVPGEELMRHSRWLRAQSEEVNMSTSFEKFTAPSETAESVIRLGQRKHRMSLTSWTELYTWSVTDVEDFWESVWIYLVHKPP